MLHIKKLTIKKTSSRNIDTVNTALRTSDQGWFSGANKVGDAWGGGGDADTQCGATSTQHIDHTFGSSNTRSIHLLLKGFLWGATSMEDASIIKVDRPNVFHKILSLLLPKKI